MTQYEKTLTNELAQRIYDASDPFEMRDNDDTPQTIADTIYQDPLAVISYLVDTIERLQA